MPDFSIDAEEILVRLTKYLLEGGVVAAAAFLIPSNHKLDLQHIILIGLVAAATFSLLDLAAPSIGASVRTGAGLSLGASIVGGIPTRAA